MKNVLSLLFVSIFIFSSFSASSQQYSTARIWNEMVLNAIRGDFARPTVHARNLYHSSVAMYDAFAVYDNRDAGNKTVFLGKTTHGFTCDLEDFPMPENVEEARKEAISFAVYRLIEHRFKNSPRAEEIKFNIDLVLSAFGYDKDFDSTDYLSGDPGAMGNYIAASLIEYGMQDGSNEANDYANEFYQPVNPELNPFLPWYDPSTDMTPGYNPDVDFGNLPMVDPNRWQKLEIPNFVGQDGFITENGVPPFLSPEWGFVDPFAMTEEDKTVKNRDGHDFWLYNDPGPPALLDTLNAGGSTDEYIWGFSMTAHWKSHTIVDTNLIWDISPGNLGNSTELPTTKEGRLDYYDFMEGGDYSTGHSVNPHTGAPYEPNLVPRSDYTRVLAEFWADGPESETPPGHWFTILNYVNDQEELVKKYKGEGPILSDMEWDVKAYLMLGGAMHDAAISAWSAKGFYDYPRPVSSIRYLVDKGQSSFPNGINYHPLGIRIVPGSIEQILHGDNLLYPDSSNFGRIKIIANIFEDEVFFGNADYWFPYQSINFVSPPFAGYVSGHSTYSRAAAEILADFTGDEFFPGGMGEFHFEQDRFLEFGTPGPTVDMSLQWGTYVDAANQSALSRIWGGIHPPIDDIPGRLMGLKIAGQVFDKVDELYTDPLSNVLDRVEEPLGLYPNPVVDNGTVTIKSEAINFADAMITVTDISGKNIMTKEITHSGDLLLDLSRHNVAPGLYNIKLTSNGLTTTTKLFVVK